MTLAETLVSIERRLWSGGTDEYRNHLDDTCLVAFTSMAGVSTREQVTASVQHADRWRDLDVTVRGVVRPVDDVAVLTYEARAVRGDAETYHALVSSGYVRRDGAWKLMFHQQTPLPAPAGERTP